jgi:hypothetical protein
MTKQDRADPRGPHRYWDTDDGLAAVMSGSAFESGQAANVLGGTAAFLRSTRCGIPGCGRPRQDPIHSIGDDEADAD